MNKTNEYMGYKLNKWDVITSPGKFAGEMYYIPYFWDIVLNSGSDSDYTNGDTIVSEIYITMDDLINFPELGDTTILELWEDSNGFVNSNHRMESE